MANDRIEELRQQGAGLAEELEQLIAVLGTDEATNETEARFEEVNSDYEATKAELEREQLKDRAEQKRLQLEEDRKRFDRNYTRSEVSRSRAERRHGPHIRPEQRINALYAWAKPSQARSEWIEDARLCGVSLAETEIKANCFRNWQNDEFDQIWAGESYRARYRQRIKEQRQQGTTPDSAGGYTVPEGMMQAIDIALLRFGGMRRVADVIRAGDGREIPWPTVNDTGNKGSIVAENAPIGQQDVVFGQLVTKPFKYVSNYVPVSWELLQDSATNMEALLGRLLGERLGRATNEDYTVGAGTTEPRGITLDAADSGVQVTTANNPTYDDIIDLKHSVDPDYREVGHGFMFADIVLAGCKKIKDSQGMPIWKSGLAENAPDTLDGDPYTINQDMPTAATGDAKFMIYGQLNKYKIHDATSITLRRLDELHALNGQVTFLAWMRSDGALLDAGTNPVKYATGPTA